MDLLELSTAKTSDFPVAPDLGQTLWPHQVAAVEYACKTRRMMLADDVGVGKTAAALATIQVLSAYPALIVVPAYLRYKWTREIGNWLPGARIRLVEPGEPLTNGATPDVFVVSYNLLETHAAALKAKSIRAFIADEGHYMKSRKADRTRACIKTAKKVDLRMILGATPVERAPKDLVSQLEVIDQLDQFGGSWHFLQHYCNRWGDNISAPSKWARWDFDGARNLDELNRRLRATCFMRRTREQVHASLPPLTLSRQDLFISNRTEYRTATLDFLGWLHTVEPDRVMAAARAEALTRVAHLRRLAAAWTMRSDLVRPSHPLRIAEHARSRAFVRATKSSPSLLQQQ